MNHGSAGNRGGCRTGVARHPDRHVLRHGVVASRRRHTSSVSAFLLNRSSDLDMDLAAKGLGAKEWNNSLKTKLTLLPKKLFRIRMSRNFGMKMLTMTNLSTECLIQLTKLGYDATPFNQILKQNAKREMR